MIELGSHFLFGLICIKSTNRNKLDEGQTCETLQTLRQKERPISRLYREFRPLPPPQLPEAFFGRPLFRTRLDGTRLARRRSKHSWVCWGWRCDLPQAEVLRFCTLAVPQSARTDWIPPTSIGTHRPTFRPLQFPTWRWSPLPRTCSGAEPRCLRHQRRFQRLWKSRRSRREGRWPTLDPSSTGILVYTPRAKSGCLLWFIPNIFLTYGYGLSKFFEKKIIDVTSEVC